MLKALDPAPTTWSWYEMKGPDAADYLQRMTTVDIPKLSEGQGLPGLILSGQGRIQTQFWIWNLGDQTFGFEVDNGTETQPNPFVSTVEQFHFAENFELKETELKPKWFFGEAKEKAFEKTEESFTLDHGKLLGGTNWISVWSKTETPPKGPVEVMSPETFEDLRIESMIPKFGAEIEDSINPLEAGLHNAISRDKGCYPGQEVIEKIYTYGSPPRRLCLIEFGIPAQSDYSVLMNLADEPVEIGRFTSFHSSKTLALAYLNKIHAKADLGIQGPDGNKGIIKKVTEYGAD